MKWLIILLLVSSCASTETLLKTKPKQEVVRIEERNFSLKHRPKYEAKLYSVSLFVVFCLIVNSKE